jgi:alpha-glutamyl/putrescinyl thymine pyrophosphorylase clade 1
MHGRVDQLVQFIIARHNVYLARVAGKPQPWSDDPILQHNKFCNIFREDDRVTRWIAKNWREPHKDDRDLWFALVIARRCINLPNTLKKLGYPVPWDPDHFLRVLKRRKRKGKLVFNSTAYKLIVGGQSGDLAEPQVELILNPLWHARSELRPHSDDTLQTFHDRLAATPFMGNSYSAQIVADLKYVGRLRHASDWWDFAASGPGSRRGLNRVLGRPTNAPWREGDWIRQLDLLRKPIVPVLEKAGLPRMHAQDLQNCLCEFNKYERIRLGEGKGRKFVPNPKPLPSDSD